MLEATHSVGLQGSKIAGGAGATWRNDMRGACPIGRSGKTASGAM